MKLQIEVDSQENTVALENALLDHWFSIAQHMAQGERSGVCLTDDGATQQAEWSVVA